jgi:hypothetical protein
MFNESPKAEGSLIPSSAYIPLKNLGGLTTFPYKLLPIFLPPLFN